MTTNIGSVNLSVSQGQFNLQNTQNAISSVKDPPVDILRKRMCIGASFDSAERGDPPRCHENTRTAILTSTYSWMDDFTTLYFFLWISGWAGTGKSAILQTLAEVYRNMRRLAASFFFSQASQDRNTTQRFVATIADHLAEFVPGAREIILDKISRHPTIFDDKSFEGQWQTLIVDTLREVPPPPAPMLIVIDGIDEIISHEEQCNFLQAILHSIPHLGPSFKILIASRPEQQIEEVFTKFGISERSRIELGNAEGDRADIELFLLCSLSRIYCRLKRLPPSTPMAQTWLDQDIIRRLVDNSSGQFIYATTVVRFAESYAGDPSASLEKIANSRSKSFKSLDHLYLIIMARIKKSIPPKHHRHLHYLMTCIYLHLVTPFKENVDVFWPKEFDKDLVNTLLVKLDPVVEKGGEYHHKSFVSFLTQPSAPHPFAITSWHISSVAKRIIKSRPQDHHLVMTCILGSSPTPELVSLVLVWLVQTLVPEVLIPLELTIRRGKIVASLKSMPVLFPLPDWKVIQLLRDGMSADLLTALPSSTVQGVMTWLRTWFSGKLLFRHTSDAGVMVHNTRSIQLDTLNALAELYRTALQDSRLASGSLRVFMIVLPYLLWFPQYHWIKKTQKSLRFYKIWNHDLKPQFRWINME
ncbi:hypothetical protein BDN72DRAFT_85603 [Pluteus cervinus]|uniref:Uncharacterized protein n=1 Tax=Pluteus cervinus TaxID=181527 RepID=A0ACD3APR3_9AGAR|nr:hypothetical protein BDN72DRAFT_85603 [Pluteus cervinus]